MPPCVCVSDLFWAAGCCLAGWEGLRLVKDLHLDEAYWTAGAPHWLWSAPAIYPVHQSPLFHWLWGALLTSMALHGSPWHQLKQEDSGSVNKNTNEFKSNAYRQYINITVHIMGCQIPLFKFLFYLVKY